VVSSSSRQPGRQQLLDGPPDGALVGDGERAQLADLVAPELDAHRVVGRGREDVDDAAAHRELAARGDHLDPRVGQLDQRTSTSSKSWVSPTRRATRGRARPARARSAG
jgi:hypothetical protein